MTSLATNILKNAPSSRDGRTQPVQAANYPPGSERKSEARIIAMACDEEYAMPLTTALRSLTVADRSEQLLDVFIFCSKFGTQVKEKVVNSLPESSVRVHWRPVNLELFEQYSTLSYISPITFARLLLPNYFPENVSRVLYLDSDILVLEDLSELWATDLSGNSFGAVVDSHSEINARRLCLTTVDSKAGSASEYFNAGILLVDLDRWREEQISEKALEYLQNNPGSLLADQDALNVASGGRWKKLDARWNCLRHPKQGFDKLQPERRPSIIHYAGPGKPWLAASLSVDAAFYDGFRCRTLFAKTSQEQARDLIERWWCSVKRFARRLGVVPLLLRLVRPENGAASR